MKQRRLKLLQSLLKLQEKMARANLAHTQQMLKRVEQAATVISCDGTSMQLSQQRTLDNLASVLDQEALTHRKEYRSAMQRAEVMQQYATQIAARGTRQEERAAQQTLDDHAVRVSMKIV